MVMNNYGTTVTNCNLAIEKAKNKADGIYCFNGLYYLVKDHKVTHYAAHGDIYEAFGVFISKIGQYNHTLSTTTNKKTIKKLLSQ